METRAAPPISEQEVFDILSHICDPEVPVLTILDLGIVRSVALSHENVPTVQPSGAPSVSDHYQLQPALPSGHSARHGVTITITPTYSGCPAMDVIGMQIRMALAGRGFSKVTVAMQLSPAWTTAWMSEAGKRKLKEYGIAPPQYQDKEAALFEQESVPCPRCSSTDTELVSQYGATSCKSMYRCMACSEPFEHFKCH